MSIILSWAFGWVLGLGAPILIAVVAGYLILFSPAPLIRQIAFNALIVAACWFGMTIITQSAVSEAVRHERAAVAAAVAVEKQRQADANAAAMAFGEAVVADLQARNADLARQITELNDAADADPTASNCGLGADSMRRLQGIGPSRRDNGRKAQ